MCVLDKNILVRRETNRIIVIDWKALDRNTNMQDLEVQIEESTEKALCMFDMTV